MHLQATEAAPQRVSPQHPRASAPASCTQVLPEPQRSLPLPPRLPAPPPRPPHPEPRTPPTVCFPQPRSRRQSHRTHTSCSPASSPRPNAPPEAGCPAPPIPAAALGGWASELLGRSLGCAPTPQGSPRGGRPSQPATRAPGNRPRGEVRGWAPRRPDRPAGIGWARRSVRTRGGSGRRRLHGSPCSPCTPRGPSGRAAPPGAAAPERAARCPGRRC